MRRTHYRLHEPADFFAGALGFRLALSVQPQREEKDLVTLILPSHLSNLVDDSIHRPSAKALELHPGSWSDFSLEIRTRYPRLAEKVFVKPGTLGSGFAVVLNDEVFQGDHTSLQMHSGDEICILVTVAGG